MRMSGKDKRVRVLIGLDQDEVDLQIIVPLHCMSRVLLHLIKNEGTIVDAALKKLSIEKSFLERIVIESGCLAESNRRFHGTIRTPAIFRYKEEDAEDL